MSNNIEVGDTVMAVKPMQCCGCSISYGETFVVRDIISEICECGFCGEIRVTTYATDGNKEFELYRLIKLRPEETYEMVCQKPESIIS